MMTTDRKYRISDVVDNSFLRFPLTLLAHTKYRDMSLEAKFVYALLLNRLTLSQRNNWINESNEVYLIYTREEVADNLNISYKKAISAFKELIKNGLVLEERQGRGYPNLIYVLKTELSDKDATNFSEGFEASGRDENKENTAPQEPENPDSAQTCQNDISRHAKTAGQDLSKRQLWNFRNGSSGTSETAHQELPNWHTSKTENNKTDFTQIENSQSVSHVEDEPSDGQTGDNKILQEILDRCELLIFSDNVASMFQNAIERLYYSKDFKVGNAVLPQGQVRSYLNLLDADVLLGALEKMKNNETTVKNPTAYLMSVIFNGICEQQSDLILSLPPEYQNEGDYFVPQ